VPTPASGRVPVIDTNPRRDAKQRQRPGGGRVNSALKDPYGGRHVRVRGHAKVACHLFSGVLALTVHRPMRPVVRHHRFRQRRPPPARGRKVPAGSASATFCHALVGKSAGDEL